MIPPSTLNRTKEWKLWHSFNYFLGGGTFLVGSFILFPYFGQYFDTDNVSAYLYSIGSFTFLLADITECFHFINKGCPYMIAVINYSLSVLASLLYVIGSILFIPALNSVPLGELLFDIGSGVIVFSQSWKLIPAICKYGLKNLLR